MTVRVPSTGYAQPLVNIGDGPCLIVNRDLVTALLLSDNNSQVSNKTVFGDPTISIVDPLGSVAVSGKEPVFGFAAAGAIEVDVKKGASYWAPSPAQVAAQINALGLAKDSSVSNVNTSISLGTNKLLDGTNASALAGAGSTIAKDVSKTGVPLLHNKTVLNSNSVGVNVASAGSQSLTGGSAVISQVSYEILVYLGTLGATATPVQIIIGWNDSNTGIATATQRYWVYAGTNSAPHSFSIRGPSKGDQVFATLINSSPNTVNVRWVTMQHSRTLNRDLGSTYVDGTNTIPIFPGFTASIMDIDNSWLASRSISITTGSHDDTLLPFYTGTVYIRGQTTSLTAGKGELRILNIADTFQTFPEVDYIRMLSGQSDSTQPNEMAMKTVPLLRSQSLLRLINNDSATQTLTASVAAYEQQ